MRFTSCLVLSFGLLAMACGAGEPPEKGDRNVTPEKVCNDRPAFAVRADVDHPDRIYQQGDLMVVSVISEKEGYLYLLYWSADGRVSCLFPNLYQQDNRIPAGKLVTVPAPAAAFQLRVAPPLGKETLKAVVTLQPVPVDKFGVPSLTKGISTPLTEDGLKSVVVELKQKPCTAWAEHQVQVTTVANRDGVRGHAPRRVAVVVALGRFADKRIRPLPACQSDGRAMAAVLKDRCGVDEVIVLVDEQATLENIEEAIRRKVADATRPGDLVLIYWTGHGARCADDNGDEKDGYEEYLVPFGGRLDDLETIRRTMLLDDTFGRWMQDLDGRKVVLILDACHSGGLVAGAKGLELYDPLPDQPFDFLDGELARTKDIGQKETAVLYSAQARQVAFARRQDDFSTMTYFLLEMLKSGHDPITLTQAYGKLKVEVPRFVEREFGTTQTPGLIDNTTPPVYLRP